ncbi:MAG: hypothetical protein V7637_6166 [Mycobacteriales bacterium]
MAVTTLPTPTARRAAPAGEYSALETALRQAVRGEVRYQVTRMEEHPTRGRARWFGEPVSSDDLDGLRRVRDAVPADVAAGEYGYDLPYFGRMIPPSTARRPISPAAAASPNGSAWQR